MSDIACGGGCGCYGSRSELLFFIILFLCLFYKPCGCGCGC